MTTPDDSSYPSHWSGARPSAPPAAPAEAIALAIDAYISALSPQEFVEMVRRTRG